jgi:hypothetical protein
MLSNGTWSFNPVPGFVGTVNIPYAISDGAGGTDTATLSITTVPYVGPDYIPLISILNPNFPIVGTVRDFRVAITEVQNSINEGQLSFRIFKPSAFTIIASDTITTVNVGGTATTLSNANWIFTETPSSVVCTLKPGLTMPAFAIRYIGFRLQRKSNIPANTTQNLTVGITSGSGGDGNINNNQTTRTVTAQ